MEKKEFRRFLNGFFQDSHWQSGVCILFYVIPIVCFVMAVAAVVLLTSGDAFIFNRLWPGLNSNQVLLGALIFALCGMGASLLRDFFEKKFKLRMEVLVAKQTVISALVAFFVFSGILEFLIPLAVALAVGVIQSVLITITRFTRYRDLEFLDLCLSILSAIGFISVAMQFSYDPDIIFIQTIMTGAGTYLVIPTTRSILMAVDAIESREIYIHLVKNKKVTATEKESKSMNDDPIIITTEENGKEKEYEVLDQILFNDQEYAFLLSYPDNASDSAELLVMHVTDEAYESVEDENLNALLKIFSDKFKEFNIVD